MNLKRDTLYMSMQARTNDKIRPAQNIRKMKNINS